MMMVKVSEETSEVVEVPIPVRLPKWLWTILYARAKAIHGNDLECCVNQLLQVGIDHEIKIKGVVGPLGRN
jgi:hypothetical protein